ncbi:WYL domain-containing protein [Novosphingobium sp. BW1]|uniref:WYL domain-containing protein n=1 Tax=Novosphingobium sp. BW1 TaxID=2592621 RepID=UPI0011DEC736|nr:WYL domain-containing protein [Novosphingobium sp. BW1]TYC89322.1 WYL domain-containing protein [Novosphingobium sp. BW1]
MPTAPQTDATNERKLIEAIALRRHIRAEYNGTEMLLAPHRLFSRHDELFLSAFNPNKNWRSEEERRLGHFKLDGLSNLLVTEEMFEPLPDFDPAPPRETDEEVFTVTA